MIRLFTSELRRIASRRFVRVTVILALVAIATGGIVAFARTSSLSEAAYQQRVRTATVARDAQRAAVDRCLQSHGQPADGQVPDAVAAKCFPRREITAHDPRFHRSRLNSVLQGTSGVLLVAAWALGASLVGAEFGSGSMTTLLTWEPRRLRVFATKFLSMVVTVGVFAVIVLCLTGFAMLPALLAHGAARGGGEPAFRAMAGTAARGTALAIFGAAMGFAIAAIGRSTAAALGIGFTYIVVFENIAGNAIAGWRRWLLLGNIIVMVSGKASSDIAGRSVAGAAIILTGVAVALLIGGAASFRWRDLG